MYNLGLINLIASPFLEYISDTEYFPRVVVFIGVLPAGLALVDGVGLLSVGEHNGVRLLLLRLHVLNHQFLVGVLVRTAGVYFERVIEAASLVNLGVEVLDLA